MSVSTMFKSRNEAKQAARDAFEKDHPRPVEPTFTGPEYRPQIFKLDSTNYAGQAGSRLWFEIVVSLTSYHPNVELRICQHSPKEMGNFTLQELAELHKEIETVLVAYRKAEAVVEAQTQFKIERDKWEEEIKEAGYAAANSYDAAKAAERPEDDGQDDDSDDDESDDYDEDDEDDN